MALFIGFGLNLILNLIIILVEFGILAGFLIIFFNKKITVLKPLLWAILFLLFSNIFDLLFLAIQDNYIITILLGFLSFASLSVAIVFLVTYLESFERDEPYSRRSTITILLIALTGVLEIGSTFLPEEFSFIVLFTPIPIVIIGILYVKYIRQISNRARVEVQKKKIRKVQFGVFMLFLAPVIISITFTFAILPLLVVDRAAFLNTLSVDNQNFNRGSLNSIIIFCQLIGVILISLPILSSRSTHFMQSRRISRIMVIADSGLPVFDFNLGVEREGTELLFSGAITAIQSVMREATGTSSELQAIVFGDLHILTEVREGFAANLLVERSSAILKDSLANFTEDFELLFPKFRAGLFDDDLYKESMKLVRLHFGIEDEELEQIMELKN